MAKGDPYPIKALITLGNNTLLSYANQHQILQALMNQELIVAHEIFVTPPRCWQITFYRVTYLRSVIMWRMAGVGAAA